MTATGTQPDTTTLTLRRTNVPARRLPPGLWIDVLAVLRAHGLDAHAAEATAALLRIVRHTPVADGGRLLPDGRIDTSEYPDLWPSWFCTVCRDDVYSDDAKARHDSWCEGLQPDA